MLNKLFSMDYKVFTILLSLLLVNLYLIRELQLAKKAILDLKAFAAIISIAFKEMKKELDEVDNKENKVI